MPDIKVCPKKVNKEHQSQEFETSILQEFDDHITELINNIEKPYNTSKEATPRLAAYHPSFHAAEQACEQIAAEAVRLFSLSKFTDAETEGIVEDFDKKGKIAYRSNQKVGLIGDSGVGKSSLINSLLDTPDLTAESGAGSACTQVITEFRSAWPDQSTPFRADIHFMDTVERRRILNGHFADLYNLRVKPSSCAEEDAGNESASRCSTADDFFAALFADRAEFVKDGIYDQDAVIALFSTAQSADDSSMLAKLHHWMEELVARYVDGDSLARCEASTTVRLTTKLDPFITGADADETGHRSPSLWPLVNFVEIGLYSPLLEQGVVLADLPGLSDLNQTRKRTAQLHMRTCEYLYVISPIARVQTEANVLKWLMFKIGGTQKTLVCTKIDADIAMNKSKPQDFKPSREDMEEYGRMSQAHQVVVQQHKLVENQFVHLEGQERKDASEKSRNLRLKKKALATLCLAALVRMRNKKVIVAMKEKYKKSIGGHGALKIVCVSNTAYSLHKEGYNEDSIPLPILVTGIPDVRFEIMALPAASRLNVMKSHVQGSLPTLLETLHCWSSASTIKKRAELRVIVAKPLEEIKTEISRYKENLKSALQETLLKKTSASRHGWIQAGKVVAKQWAKEYKAPQYKAWCVNNGEHRTAIKTHSSWNAELLEAVEKDLMNEWQCFNGKIEELGRTCAKSLKALVESIRTEIKEIRGLSRRAITPFSKTLTSKKTLLDSVFEHVSVDLKKTSDNIRMIATTDVDDGYLKESMLSVYNRAQKKTGAGSYNERIKIIESAVSQGVPFSEIEIRVKDDFDQAFELEGENIVLEVTKVFERILGDFGLMFVVEELPNSQRDALRHEMKLFVARSKAEIDSRIAVELARAETECDR